MKDLRKILDIFDEYQIPMKKQAEIIKTGVDTTVSMMLGNSIYTKHYHFDCDEFADFILYMQCEWCDLFNLRFDVNGFLAQENNALMSQPLQLFKAARDLISKKDENLQTKNVKKISFR